MTFSSRWIARLTSRGGQSCQSREVDGVLQMQCRELVASLLRCLYKAVYLRPIPPYLCFSAQRIASTRPCCISSITRNPSGRSGLLLLFISCNAASKAEPSPKQIRACCRVGRGGCALSVRGLCFLGTDGEAHNKARADATVSHALLRHAAPSPSWHAASTCQHAKGKVPQACTPLAV